MKRLFSLLLALSLALILSSCSAVGVPGGEQRITYPAGSDREIHYLLTEAGEYTFRQVTEDENIVCTAFFDGEPVTPRSRPGSCAFSVTVPREGRLRIVCTNPNPYRVAAVVRLLPYENDPETDVNYHHAIDLDPGVRKVQGSEQPLVYRFTAPQSGIYAVELPADTESFRLLADDSGVRPSEKAEERRYPAEEYGAPDGRLVHAVALEAGEAVFLECDTVSAEDVIRVSRHTAAPDGESAVEYIRFLYDTFHGDWTECLRTDSVLPLTRQGAVRSVTSPRLGSERAMKYENCRCENGEPVSEYCTGREFEQSQSLALSSGKTPVIYRLEDLTAALHLVRGPGAALPESGEGIFVSTAGYAFLWPEEAARSTERFVSGTAVQRGDGMEVRAVVTRDIPIPSFESPVTVTWQVVNTEEGVRIRREEQEDVEPVLPDVFPVRYSAGFTATVCAQSGIGLYAGPGQGQRLLLTVPDGTALRCYGRSDGWLFVKFAGVYGWIDGERTVHA